MKNGNRGLTRFNSRGTASVEAVIVLPVFVILFVGIFFARDLQAAKLASEQQARRCAWEYSYTGCDPDHRPSGCTVPDADQPLAGDLSEVIDRVNLDDQSLSTIQGDLGLGKVVRDLIRDQVVSRLAAALTHDIEATTTVERERPNLFGAGKTVIDGKYRLACNLRPQTPAQLLDTAWHKLMP